MINGLASQITTNEYADSCADANREVANVWKVFRYSIVLVSCCITCCPQASLLIFLKKYFSFILKNELLFLYLYASLLTIVLIEVELSELNESRCDSIHSTEVSINLLS